MASITSAPPAVNGLPADLAEDLAASGWSPGWPDGITPESRAVDMRVCRAMRCPACRGRGLRGQPYHRGRGYRLVAECPRCGHVEEL